MPSYRGEEYWIILDSPIKIPPPGGIPLFSQLGVILPIAHDPLTFRSLRSLLRETGLEIRNGIARLLAESIRISLTTTS
ncbi:MAG: hypothetical protein QGF78_01040 [Candidatus Bathyarchaeota archaeon]|nr:hypothetical protein [Candidatus Bathyarchaeota archaeon]